jgi:hypothetical protein
MRLLMMLTACLGIALAQSNQDTEPNTSCIERLQVPVYPPLAAAARVSGSVTATINLTTNGTIESTNMEVGSSIPNVKLLLTPAVERSIRGSTFRKTCDGKSVRLVFHFGFDSDPYKRVSFGYPNQFWISVIPPTPISEP